MSNVQRKTGLHHEYLRTCTETQLERAPRGATGPQIWKHECLAMLFDDSVLGNEMLMQNQN